MANHFATALVLVAALLTGCAGADTSAPQESGDGVSPEPTSTDTRMASCAELADEVIAQVQGDRR